jgi:alkenylglycerophosphocholine/alkenylglycerophosphoethanolamine hydrolase
MSSRAPALLAGYGVVCGLNVLGHVLEQPWLRWLTKPLLMPLLAGYLLAASGRPLDRRSRLVLVALVWSWVGDLMLMGEGETFLLAGLGGFLLAQLTYLAAFGPSVRSGLLGRQPALVAPYVIAWAGLLAVLGPRLDDLLLPVTVYGASLVAMAATATGVHRRTAVGAGLFVVSDALIALTRLTGQLPLRASRAEPLVMSTYTLGQALITSGVVAAARPADPR